MAADGVVPQPSSVTLPGTPVSTFMSPGRYVATVMPSINGDMGKRLEASISKVPGVNEVKADALDSTIRFTVKEGGKVRADQVQKAVAKASANAVMNTPILDKSLSSAPGL
jgi:copper chaperone CopZ